MAHLLQPMYINFDQISTIIPHTKIQQKYYIQNIDAICIIAQDWIKTNYIVIFYTVLKYKTKLTNSIHFMVFCTNFESTTTNYVKKQERKKYIRKVHDIPSELQLTQFWFDDNSRPFIYVNRPIQVVCNGVRIITIIKETKYFGVRSIDGSPSYLNIVNNNNWEIRRHFAILHHALKNYFVKNKETTTNKAGKVLSNKILIMKISQYV